MNLQQTLQPRSAANGFNRRNVVRDVKGPADSKMRSVKPAASTGSKEDLDSSSRDRLIYVSTCLIGLPVEVRVRNGSILTGIFHSANCEKDFGVLLKMARVLSDGSQKGQNKGSDIVKRPQTIIIPARELVQVIAKDVPLTGEIMTNGHLHDKRQDLLTDSAISLPHRVEERELERWIPDSDDPQCNELEDIFDGSWNNRKWDQFETNAALFGVKSTFDEELYTTKLQRGPQMKELELEASRIAKEIEGETTVDIHLAEERGLNLYDNFGLDEESRYSAVSRGGTKCTSDGMYHEEKNLQPSTHVSTVSGKACHSSTTNLNNNISEGKATDSPEASTSYSETDKEASSLISSRTSEVSAASVPHTRVRENAFSSLGEGCKSLSGQNDMAVSKEVSASKGNRPKSPNNAGNSTIARGSLSSNAAEYFSHAKASASGSSQCTDTVGSVASLPVPSNPRPGSSTSRASDTVSNDSLSNGPGLSPCSSVGSLASEKSKLNPNAKEFKLNPNAKSFVPSSSSLRPQSPVAEGPLYYTANASTIPHMPGLPVGVGFAPSYAGNQPAVYNPQAMQLQLPHPYIHPGGPLYGQQVYIGQPRPVVYTMPTYPEMPFKGREF